MKNTKILYGIIFALLFCLFHCGNDSKKAEHKSKESSLNSDYQNAIIEQGVKKRIFVSMKFDTILSINLEQLKKPVYVPSYCQFDDEGNLFVLDRSEFLIHKFSFNDTRTAYTHKAFGHGGGQGPGQFTTPTDFKVFNERIFIVDVSNGCIELYSTTGDYIKRITMENRANGVVPYKIVVLDNNTFIFEPQGYPTDALFYISDTDGNILKRFGNYIVSSQSNNFIYHDNNLSELIEDSMFYYLPYYLGCVALYKKDKLIFAKSTIDGLQNPAVVKKEIMKGVIGRKLNRKIETVVRHSINHDYNYMIVQAYHRENKKFFIDVYDLKNFNYIFSIKNLPKINNFDIQGKFIAGTYHNNLTIYNIDELNNRIVEYGR